MKIKNISFILVVLALSLSFASCEKWIDIEPQQSLSQEEALVSIKDHKAALLGIYSLTRSEDYYGQAFTVLPDIMSDNASITTVNNGAYTSLYDYTFHTGTYEVRDFWTEAYRIVANANNIINSMNDKKFEGDLLESERNHILGETYALRGIALFDIAKTFASAYNPATAASTPGIPVVTTTSKDIFPARATLLESYKQITEDLEEAAKLLLVAETTDKETVDNNRIGYVAVKAMLTRVYLAMKDYDKVISTYNDIKGNIELALNADDYAKIWGESVSPEILWQIEITTKDSSPQIGWVYWYDVKERPDYVATSEIMGLYSTDDYRKSVCYKKEGSRWTVRKYITNPSVGLSGVNNIKVIRTAEVVLNAVEAYIAKTDATAKTLFAQLYEARRPGVTFDNTISDADLKIAYNNERRAELAFEGQRWFDLKRNGADMVRIPTEGASAGAAKTIVSTSKYWNWPIPTSELNANKNLVQDSKW